MDSQRSGSRSRGGNSHNRNSILSGGNVVVPISSNSGVRASMSKTAREPGEEEEVKQADEIDVKPQETVSTARRVEPKKYYNKHSSNNQGEKPQSSSRSNNLEIWLSKKKALDQ